jgi:hypothetical protein
MGDPSAPPSLHGGSSVSHTRRPERRRLLATLPFTLALALAGATLQASLAPTHDVGEDLRQKNAAPPPPAESSPVHHDEAVFDPLELVSV